MKNLPIGIQTFERLINEGYVYIDKTKYLYDFAVKGGYYFISRPRRFGKSLTVTTLKSLFKGKKELFKDLWIYDKIEWQEHPVIHIDFNIVTHNLGLETFKRTLLSKLRGIGEEYNLNIELSDPKDYFSEIAKQLSKINKVVLLIDEYDKPIIDYIDDIEKADENKKYLSSFYEAIKGLDEYWKFVFLTGVSKFSKVSIFSKLNNLRDITLVDEYGGMLGITEEELYNTFEEEIKEIAEKEEISADELKLKIRKWYNGYTWNGKTKVYNPFSILNYFADKSFNNYWFATGTPTFLIEQIKKKEYDISDLELTESTMYMFDSFDIENIDLTTLLFQTGYLTIERIEKDIDESKNYILSVPNNEVKMALVNYLLANYTKKEVGRVKTPYMNMLKMLRDEKIEEFITQLKTIYASIPYILYVDKEAYYHSLFYLMLSIMGAKIDVEVLTDKGRIDGVVEIGDLIYVIEFKMGTAKEAMEQIKDRKYYEKFMDRGKKIVLLGVGGFKEKEIEYEMFVYGN